MQIRSLLERRQTKFRKVNVWPNPLRLQHCGCKCQPLQVREEFHYWCESRTDIIDFILVKAIFLFHLKSDLFLYMRRFWLLICVLHMTPCISPPQKNHTHLKSVNVGYQRQFNNEWVYVHVCFSLFFYSIIACSCYFFFPLKQPPTSPINQHPLSLCLLPFPPLPSSPASRCRPLSAAVVQD